MKILIVSQYIHPEVGGGPTRITNLTRGLCRQGQEVDVLTCLPNYPRGRIYEGYRGCISRQEEFEGATLYRYWTYATVSKSPIKRALSMMSFSIVMWLFAFKRKKIKEHDRVIIQSPTLFVATSAMWMFKGLYHKKCILNVSDLWPSSAVDLGAMKEGGRAWKVMHWCERYLYRKADAVMGQSNEILAHISKFPSSPKKFLYRHLQPYEVTIDHKERNPKMKIVYAGVLNAGQDMLALIKGIDFHQIGVEFHLYGGGTQQEEIKTYIKDNPDCDIFYYGFVSKERIVQELPKYDASIIPLAVRIRGAVPSKIYDILPSGMPVLFCGGGEGAEIVKKYDVGYVSEPGDFRTLADNIVKLSNLSEAEYIELSKRCVRTAKEDLNFEKQMKGCIDFLASV